MGIMVKKDEEIDNPISNRINAELREKISTTSNLSEDPDLAEDSDYMKDLQKTSKFGWIWIVLITLAIVALVVILI